MISFLLPTRKRYNILLCSIDSILDNIDDWDSFEILFATDNDDPKSKDVILHHMIDRSFNNFKIIDTFDRQGYSKLYIYYNELATHAQKKWLWIWNDDVRLHTKNPNLELLKYNDDFILINPRTGLFDWKIVDSVGDRDKLVLEFLRYGKHMELWGDHTTNCIPFPIIPKKWHELTGHISLDAVNDTWIEVIGKWLNQEVLYNRAIKTDSNIIVRNCCNLHEDGNSMSYLNDEVCQSKQEWVDAGLGSKFWDREPEMRIDFEKLKTYLLDAYTEKFRNEFK